jgi:hypothetical protein
VEGERERRVGFDDVERARTVFTWTAAPKPGKGPRPAARSARTPAPAAPVRDPEDQTGNEEEE